jgi:hypothetical protein
MKYYIIQECEYIILITQDPCNLAIEEFDDREIAEIVFEEMEQEDIYGEFYFKDKLPR